MAKKKAAKRSNRTKEKGSAMAKLIPPKNGVTVRMYRIGHGDCFVIAMPRDGGGDPVPVGGIDGHVNVGQFIKGRPQSTVFKHHRAHGAIEAERSPRRHSPTRRPGRPVGGPSPRR